MDFRSKGTRWGRFETDPRVAIKRLVAAPPTLGSLAGMPFQLYAEHHDKSRWGDKRPHYVQRIPALLAMFPDAQFVNVVRDPRACVASIHKLGWFHGDVALATELWGRALRAADAARERLAPDQLVEIRYEDLVSDPYATLQRLCAFLGLSAEGIGAMLRYHRDADVPENRFHWRVSQPVTAATMRGWEGMLSAAEVAFVERVTAGAMQRYGYEPGASGVRVPPRLLRVFARRRLGTTLSRAKVSAREARSRRSYPYPVAARLTPGQTSNSGA